MTDKPNVTDADREAAAKWAKMQGRPHQAANMLHGSCDTAPLVKLMAAHRIAAERETEARIVAWLRVQSDKEYPDHDSKVYECAADAIEREEHRHDH